MKIAKPEVIIVGSGGLASEFICYFAKQVKIVGCITKKKEEAEKFDKTIKLLPPDLLLKNAPSENIIIAIGSPKTKRLLYSELKDKGFKFPSLIHSSSIVSETADLKEGVIINPMCMVGPRVSIGRCVYINYQVGIGHDSTIGEFTQINPGSQLGGSTIIKGDSIIGSNSTILQKTYIEQNITVGSAAVVVGRKLKKGTIAPLFSKYLPF